MTKLINKKATSTITKVRRHGSIIRRKQRKRQSNSKNQSKKLSTYYYAYYKGWCEDRHCLLFDNSISAMLWQLSQLYRDGFTHVFADELPDTFATIGILEVFEEMNGKNHNCFLHRYCGFDNITTDTKSTFISSSNLTNSMVTKRFFSNVTWYSIIDDDFFQFTANNYLKRLHLDIYKNTLQPLYGKPDFHSSSNSILGSNNAVPSLCNINDNEDLLSTIPEGTRIPRCLYDNRLWICSIFKNKQHLKGINDSASCFMSLNNSNIFDFSRKHAKLIRYLKCTRVIVSIGSGNGATEITSSNKQDYVICLDNSKRDLCTGIFSMKLISNQSGHRNSRVVFRYFNMNNMNVLQRLVLDLNDKTGIQPIILFQHPTPQQTFVKNVFIPAIDSLLQLVVIRTIEKIVFVYDSRKINQTSVGDTDGIRFITRKHVSDIVDSKEGNAYQCLDIGEECRISIKGQEETLHPLFPSHKRKGWAQMKKNDEYCFVVCRCY